MAFRINTTKLFLTYPQCNEEKDTLFSFLTEFFADNLQNVIVATELHKDGTPHLHAYVALQRRWDCKNANALDFNGFHPNIQPVKSAAKVMNYVMKDGDFKCLHDPEETYAGCKDVLELEQYITTKYNEKFWLTFSDKIITTWTAKRQVREPYVSKYTRDSFIPFPVIENWMSHDRLLTRPLCLVVIGDSRLGKTQYVRSFSTNHVYFKGGWRLDDWDDHADYAVFDDWNWDDVQKYLGKRLIGCDDEIIATDKYRGKRRIRPVPAIIIANDDPRSLAWFDDWWKLNTIFALVVGKLYNCNGNSVHNV